MESASNHEQGLIVIPFPAISNQNLQFGGEMRARLPLTAPAPAIRQPLAALAGAAIEAH